MELQTKVQIDRPDFFIGYNTKIMMLGSCFTENMGEKLEYFRFTTDVNPCGIVYNPASAANVLKILLERKRFTATDLIWNNGKWVSLFHHGSFSSSDQAECLRGINERLTTSAEQLKQADLLIITFGTSWVYRYLENGNLASNCHKLPATSFERFRLRVDEIIEEYKTLIERLRKQNPGIRILFTVSPIRHWKDGAHGNQLSKSVLLLAIDEFVRQLQNVYYFPSYEIVMDELRDYRFYVEDMLHVSAQATDYIWERFKETYISKEADPLMKRIDNVNKMKRHRPLDIDGEAYGKLQQRIWQEETEIDLLMDRTSKMD